jgi:hypothetical protein
MTDRYDGNGNPIWHDHFGPARISGEVETDADIMRRTSDDFRFDVLEFANGKIAVWSPRTGTIISYAKNRMNGIRDAMRAANAAYRKTPYTQSVVIKGSGE